MQSREPAVNRLNIDGTLYPITGHWCRRCGLPLTPITDTQQEHPLCETEGAANEEQH